MNNITNYNKEINNIILGTMNINSPFTSNIISSEQYYKEMIETYI
jgi:hypothetical protein